MDFVYALMVPSWADQHLPKLLMEQFDTLPIQCRHIEYLYNVDTLNIYMNEFDSEKKIQNGSCEHLDNFSLIRLLYMH